MILLVVIAADRLTPFRIFKMNTVTFESLEDGAVKTRKYIPLDSKLYTGVKPTLRLIARK